MPDLIYCDCGVFFRPSDSMGSYFHQCQNCWEAEADRMWWAYLQSLDPRRCGPRG